MDKLQFATREHLRQLHDLAGVRNANRILSELETAKLIQSFRKEAKIYSLAKAGRDLIGSTQEVARKVSYIEHALLRNDAYLRLGMPDDWRTEERMRFKVHGETVSITPDATFSHGNIMTFIEIDRTQSMRENRKKLERYAHLLPLIEQQFSKPPIVVFFTVSDSRKRRIKQACDEYRVRAKVYTKSG